MPFRGGLGVQRRAEAVFGIANRRVSRAISDFCSGRMGRLSWIIGSYYFVANSWILVKLSLTTDDKGNRVRLI